MSREMWEIQWEWEGKFLKSLSIPLVQKANNGKGGSKMGSMNEQISIGSREACTSPLSVGHRLS